MKQQVVIFENGHTIAADNLWELNRYRRQCAESAYAKEQYCKKVASFIENECFDTSAGEERK